MNSTHNNAKITYETPVKSKRKFSSCLNSFEDYQSDDLRQTSPRSKILKRALSINELDDNSWLSSSLIDLTISKMAKRYNETRFLPVDFERLTLSKAELDHLTDINGKMIDYTDTEKPFLIIFNARNIHWNLIRVVLRPKPELQLFEPMGMPQHRRDGLNYRRVPRTVIQWLDTCCTLPNNISWITQGNSAIISPQQITSFDCGVACLLYAEKCAQGQVIFLITLFNKCL